MELDGLEPAGVFIDFEWYSFETDGPPESNPALFEGLDESGAAWLKSLLAKTNGSKLHETRNGPTE